MNDQVKTSPGAIWSLVLGILGVCCCTIFTAIPAVICGHIALSKIKKSAGALAGNGLAIAGLVLGYIGIAIAIFIIPMQIAIAIPSFMKARETSQKNACINNLRMIAAAKDAYALDQSRGNGWAFPDNNEAFRCLKGFLRAYPACPDSKNTAVKSTPERSAADYEVNPIGSNSACKTHPETHTLK